MSPNSAPSANSLLEETTQFMHNSGTLILIKVGKRVLCPLKVIDGQVPSQNFPQKIIFRLVNSYIFNKIEENRSGIKNWGNFLPFFPASMD